jgi:8-hydroxy-5-deazaflavin:NADPH oxidoreductase
VTRGKSMKLSILGSGRVAYSVARRAIAAGHEIVIGSSDPSKIDREKWLDLPSVKFTSISEAGLDDVVLLAVPWEHIDHILEQIPTWDRRILIDATNPFVGTPLRLLDLGGQNASLLISKKAPGAEVVKAFNSIKMEIFDLGPKVKNGTRILFVSGDERRAKERVIDFIESLGFKTIDLGGLAEGGLIQQAGGPLAGKDIILNE